MIATIDEAVCCGNKVRLSMATNKAMGIGPLETSIGS